MKKNKIVIIGLILTAVILSACASQWSSSNVSSTMETPVDVQLILLADNSIFYSDDPLKTNDIKKRSSLAYNNYVQAIVRTPGELSQYDGDSAVVVPLGADLMGSANALDISSEGEGDLLGSIIGAVKGATTIARRVELTDRISKQVTGKEVVDFLQEAVDASDISNVFTSQDAPIKWSIVQDYRGDIFGNLKKDGRSLSAHYPLPDKALSAKHIVIVKLGEIITGKFRNKALAFSPVSVALVDSASREILYNSVLLTEPKALPAKEKTKPFMSAELDMYYSEDLKMETTKLLNEMFMKDAIFGNK